jgi:hypothetical protein
MATPQTYQRSVLPLRVAEAPRNLAGLSQLFEAAVINRKFCQLLLSQPEAALRQGYLGNTFDLTMEEQALIISIQARSLPDLARQVTTALG